MIAALLLVLAGCPSAESLPPPRPAGPIALPDASGPIPEQAHIEARDYYRKMCVSCHGEAGRGDGPAADVLAVKPRDFAAPGFLAGVDQGQLQRVILEGGPAVGKSAQMPPHPILSEKPQVLRALGELVREMGAAK